MNITKSFEVGKTYFSRSIGDHNCIITAKVIKRTAKMVTCEIEGEVKRFRVAVWQGVETFKPWGSFSMAPTIRAEKELIESDETELDPLDDWNYVGSRHHY